MIDTDKYEGHTPADEWRLVFTEGAWCRDKQMLGLNVVVHDLHQMQACDPDLYLIAEANHALAKDAPLILQALIDKQEEYTRFTLYAEAEIKRLRDAIDEIANEIEAAELGYASTYVVRNPYTSKDVLQPRKMFEDLRKVILQ